MIGLQLGLGIIITNLDYIHIDNIDYIQVMKTKLGSLIT